MQGFRNHALALACCALLAGGIGMNATAATPAASSAKPAAGNAANPFFQPSTLPFGTFDFARLKDSDYVPAMEAGMITSDEPGIYREGEYGIRTESITLCVPAATWVWCATIAVRQNWP